LHKNNRDTLAKMAEYTGGYDYEFVAIIPEDLICSLCHLAFKNPLQIEACGHTFCTECFDQIKNQAMRNTLDVCCPLDRQKIDLTRVFYDKSDERKVLNLIVRCPYFADDCEWTGELRDVLDHETKCCKNKEALYERYDLELKQVLYRVAELEFKVKSNEEIQAEKDQQIENQNKKIEDQNKKIEDLNKKIEDQNKKLEDQNKKLEDQNKKIEDPNKKIEDLNLQFGNQNKQIESLRQVQTNMISPNNGDASDFYPVSTAYQWKFNPTEVRSGNVKHSPPFYNFMSSQCFKILVEFKDNNFILSLGRWRGKYDNALDTAIKTTKDFNFYIHVIGTNEKQNVSNYSNNADYSILEGKKSSAYWYDDEISHGEIVSLTIDGYVHLHCFFKNII